MTQARELYAAGNLAGAIEAITREVKANPTDTARRSFLFELLCFAGEWDRAEKQLDVLAGQGPTAEVGAKVYRNNVRAERDRQRLLVEVSDPHFLTEPPAYVDMHLEALRQLRDGNTQAAREILDRAEEERPALAGTLDGAAFEDLRDYDDRFAPVLEIIVSDKYTWLPFEQIKRIEITPPEQLRDLIWAPASIETTDNELKAFLPLLYPGSCRHSDDRVRFGRMTDWTMLADELYAGAGLRLLAVDGEEKPLLEVGSLSFAARDGEASADSGDEDDERGEPATA